DRVGHLNCAWIGGWNIRCKRSIIKVVLCVRQYNSTDTTVGPTGRSLSSKSPLFVDLFSPCVIVAALGSCPPSVRCVLTKPGSSFFRLSEDKIFKNKAVFADIIIVARAQVRTV